MAHRIAVCMLNEDLEGFADALEAFKEENDFSASLSLAQEFYYSREDEYSVFIELIAKLRPNLLTVRHEEYYGQPLFRQVFKNGSEKTLNLCYLDEKKRVVDGKLLKELLQDARRYHEEALDRLNELKDISFLLYRSQDLDENGDWEELFYDYVQDDPRDIIRHLNTVVRQRRMLKKLEECVNNG